MDYKEMDSYKSVEQKIASFSQHVESLSASDRKKALWIETYSNAVRDRSLAYSMYKSITVNVEEDPSQHAVHGATIAKYLERMSKSNDQILKLSELVGNVEEATEELDQEQIYGALLK